MASERVRLGAREGVVNIDAAGGSTGLTQSGLDAARTPSTRSVDPIGEPETENNFFIPNTSCSLETANTHQKSSICEASLMFKFSLATTPGYRLCVTKRTATRTIALHGSAAHRS